MTKHVLASLTALAALAGSVAMLPAHGADADGKAVFQKNCAACHMATGKGIPGAFPALAGSAFVLGPVKDPATVLLKGRGGMPDFSQTLTDSDIAAVVTYVRASWGNKAGGITAQQVTAMRNEVQAGKFSTTNEMSNKH